MAGVLELETLLTKLVADTSQFMSPLDNAIKELEDLEKMAKKVKNVDLQVNAKSLESSLAMAKMSYTMIAKVAEDTAKRQELAAVRSAAAMQKAAESFKMPTIPWGGSLPSIPLRNPTMSSARMAAWQKRQQAAVPVFDDLLPLYEGMTTPLSAGTQRAGSYNKRLTREQARNAQMLLPKGAMGGDLGTIIPTKDLEAGLLQLERVRLASGLDLLDEMATFNSQIGHGVPTIYSKHPSDHWQAGPKGSYHPIQEYEPFIRNNAPALGKGAFSTGKSTFEAYADTYALAGERNDIFKMAALPGGNDNRMVGAYWPAWQPPPGWKPPKPPTGPVAPSPSPDDWGGWMRSVMGRSQSAFGMGSTLGSKFMANPMGSVAPGMNNPGFFGGRVGGMVGGAAAGIFAAFGMSPGQAGQMGGMIGRNVSAGFQLGVQGMQSGWQMIKGAAQTTGEFITGTFKRVFNPSNMFQSAFVLYTMKSLAEEILKPFTEFDDAMAQAVSIMPGTTDTMRGSMEDRAMAVSKGSINNATELAHVYFVLASAGYDAAQAMEALNLVDKFAIAGNMEAQKAAQYLADTTFALGLKSNDATENMENMTRVANALTAANILASGSVEDFAAALSNKAAGSLRQVNKDVEEGTAVLMAFAQQGLKGKAAGEALHMVIRDLQSAFLKSEKKEEGQVNSSYRGGTLGMTGAVHAAGDANPFVGTLRNSMPAIKVYQNAWKELGVEVFDAEDKMRNLGDILIDLHEKIGGMSDKDQAKALRALGFQDRSVSRVQQLLGFGEQIKEWEQELRDFSGTTLVFDIAANRMNSFSSQSKILNNNLYVMAINIGKQLVPWMVLLNQMILQGINWWEGLSQSTKNIVINVVALSLAFTTALVAIKLFTGIIGFLVAPIAAVVGFVFSLGLGVLSLGLEMIASIPSIIAWGISLYTASGPLLALAIALIAIPAILAGIGVGIFAVAAVVAYLTGSWKTLLYVVLGGLAAMALLAAAVAIPFMVMMAPFAIVAVLIMGVLAGIAAAVGYLVYWLLEATGVIEYFSEMWGDASDSMGEFFRTASMFMQNFTQNMMILINWVKDNWGKLWENMGKMASYYLSNPFSKDKGPAPSLMDNIKGPEFKFGPQFDWNQFISKNFVDAAKGKDGKPKIPGMDDLTPGLSADARREIDFKELSLNRFMLDDVQKNDRDKPAVQANKHLEDIKQILANIAGVLAQPAVGE